MREIKLKPCPFCGGEAEYTERGNQYSGISQTQIKCKRCNTKQVHGWIRLKYDFDYVKKATMDDWNKRERDQKKVAFDKERVIEELRIKAEESKRFWNDFDDEEAFGEMNAFNKAIEIVKKGGIE